MSQTQTAESLVQTAHDLTPEIIAVRDEIERVRRLPASLADRLRSEGRNESRWQAATTGVLKDRILEVFVARFRAELGAEQTPTRQSNHVGRPP
jgi:hypothetical protein